MTAVICISPGHVEAVLTALKTRPCPNCQKIGFLNRHGVLLGYDDQNPCKKSIRANRVFCNNRASAKGCGHTFSVWLAETIKRLPLSAQRLWLFLSSAVNDFNKATAFEALKSSLSPSTAYRIWNRFLNAQSAIRTALSNLSPAPVFGGKQPAQQTIEHLKDIWTSATQKEPTNLSPIAFFQAKFQTFFF